MRTKDLYNRANLLVVEIQQEKISYKKDEKIAELLRISDRYLKYVCNVLIRKTSQSLYTAEDIFSFCVYPSLARALDWYKPEKGNSFLGIWTIFIRNDFINLCRSNDRVKALKQSKIINSLDEMMEYGSEDILGTQSMFEDDWCRNEALLQYVLEFEQKHKNGAVIRCYTIADRETRNKALAKALGAETYGENERKKASRAMADFRRFLEIRGITGIENF